jgi:hypothetical protein
VSSVDLVVVEDASKDLVSELASSSGPEGVAADVGRGLCLSCDVGGNNEALPD